MLLPSLLPENYQVAADDGVSAENKRLFVACVHRLKELGVIVPRNKVGRAATSNKHAGGEKKREREVASPFLFNLIVPFFPP